MESIELEVQSIAEAIKKAQEIFKVPKEDIVIQVLSEEKKGLFGRPGSKHAKIRASIKKKT